MTEDEMVGWHHRLDRHEFKQALGVGDGQGPQLSLATRGEDWASQGQPKGKAEIPVVTRELEWIAYPFSSGSS